MTHDAQPPQRRHVEPAARMLVYGMLGALALYGGCALLLLLLYLY